MASTSFTRTLSNTSIYTNQMYSMSGGSVPSNARINSVSIAVSCSRNDSSQPGYWNNSGYKTPLKIYKTSSTSSTLIATYKKIYAGGQYSEEKTINNSSGLLGCTEIYWYWERTGDGVVSINNATVTVTVDYSPLRSITVQASPAGAGSVSANRYTAYSGDSVTLSQSASSGYLFNGWSSSPGVSISSNAFSMPDSNIVVYANYLQRSTASLSKSSMSGGESVTLAISMQQSSFTHKYKLSFGSGMETSEISLGAGVSSATISIPASWSNYIPSATSKTGGTLTLKTYSGSTLVGTYTISGLVYNVPSSAVPSVGAITTSIVRTVGGKTYANVGNYYIQGHSAVRIQANGSGSYGSSIAHLQVSVSGYSGGNYNKTQTGASVDFTTGLLTIAGTATITVVATDSRGRTASRTTTITVTRYNAPSGVLTVWRVDANGNADPNGEYGQYSLTKSYTQVGSNSLSSTLSCSQGSESSPAAMGNILPSSRKTFSILSQYEITLTLTDQFETTYVKAILQSGKFIMNISADGSKIAFMKAVTKTPPAGKLSTFEIPDTCQFYIGDETLEAFILRIVSGS